MEVLDRIDVQNDPVNWMDPWGLFGYIENEINCIGYAMGFGSYVEPEGRNPLDNKQSLKELVNEFGYTCYGPIKSSAECNCSEGEDKMIVYITRYRENPGNNDPWNDPWIFNTGNDYHAMRQDSKSS